MITLNFPDFIKNSANLDENDDISYDAESLLTSIPVEKTINYIINKLYVQKEIEPLCKKFIFKKLLLNLTKECLFSANRKLIKQIDG